MTSTATGAIVRRGGILRARLGRGGVGLSATIGGDDFSILAARARKGSRLVGDDELLEAPDTMGEEEEVRW